LATLTIPRPSLVLLVGIACSGKTTFAARHFMPTEVVSSDAMRALVADDENDQAATPGAFEVLHLIVRLRLMRRLTTVVDATNLQASGRATLLELARRYDIPAVAIVLDLPLAECLKRNLERRERSLAASALRAQARNLRDAVTAVAGEGFAAVQLLQSCQEVDALRIVRR
jgi:protein phosphatase